jgi:hypothetical protein
VLAFLMLCCYLSEAQMLAVMLLLISWSIFAWLDKTQIDAYSDCCISSELYLSISQDSIVVKCWLMNINRKWYIAVSIWGAAFVCTVKVIVCQCSLYALCHVCQFFSSARVFLSILSNRNSKLLLLLDLGFVFHFSVWVPDTRQGMLRTEYLSLALSSDFF